jgi:hypothetical protein
MDKNENSIIDVLEKRIAVLEAQIQEPLKLIDIISNIKYPFVANQVL